MPKTLQFRRGTTAELSTVCGSVAELFIDTSKNTVVLMDGSTAGGITVGNLQGNIQLGKTGANEIDTSSGNLTIDSAGGTVTVDDNLVIAGDLTVQGTTTTVNSTVIDVQNSLRFEGATSDAFETNLTVTDPTADRTITLPNATGYVPVFTSQPTSAIADGTSGQVLTTNGCGALSFATVGADLVNDTTPQLGGNLDLNCNNITGTGCINIAGSGCFARPGYPYVELGGSLDGRVYSWYGEFNTCLCARHLKVGNRGQQMSGASNCWGNDHTGIILPDNTYLGSSAGFTFAVCGANTTTCGTVLTIPQSSICCTFPGRLVDALDQLVSKDSAGWKVEKTDNNCALSAGITSACFNGCDYIINLDTNVGNTCNRDIEFYVPWTDFDKVLGGDLNLNANNIVGSGNINITGNITANCNPVAYRTRTVAECDGVCISINADCADMITQNNTQSSGTLTVNAPTGCFYDGQRIMLRVKSTNAQTLSFNAVYDDSDDLTLPTSTSGSSKTDYLGFAYNNTSCKWEFVGKIFGF